MVGEYLLTKLTNPNKRVLGSDEFRTMTERVSRFFADDRNLRALKQLYSPAELGAMSKVRETMMEMDSIHTPVGRTNVLSGLGVDQERLRTLLASYYGIIQGRGVFMLSNMITKSLGMDPALNAQRVIMKAMLDPEYAATLLRRNTDKDAVQKVHTYLANNYPESLNMNR